MKVQIYDCETLLQYFLIKFYDPETDQWFKFGVNKWENSIDSMVSFIEERQDYYFVGFNCLRFDSQVIEWIIRNYNNWHDLPSLEITKKIWQKAQDIIDDANYDIFPEYREDTLSFKQIDLFKIHHLDNLARKCSLKQLEFFLGMENIEEMPINHDQTNLTQDDIVTIDNYCKNDILATYELYLLTIGKTDFKNYKENNQIQLRLDIQKEFNINCLNYSDSKIGDEIVKKYYCEEKGIEYKNLPKKGFFRKEIKIKNCIAPYIKFKTRELQSFLEKIKKQSLGLKDDFKESINFYENTYSFMKGGLHTENKPKIYEADENYLIIDWDVASYYPAIIINNNKYPFHLGKEFLNGYNKVFQKRIELKPLSKKDKRIKGIVDALKLSVNAVYGKSSDMQSWIYDRQLTMFTTITGELSLMMLIEAYELSNIKVISANTDGVTILVNKNQIDKVENINKEWQNLTNFILERTDYKKMVFSSVNDYIAIKTDNEIKQKGDYLTDFNIYQNNSKRIVPIALKEYFVNNIPIEQTIKNHKNIYDFCIRQKASKDFHYEGVSKKGTSIYKKLIRYYVSNEGEKLLKIKNPSCQTNAAPVSQVEAGNWVCYVCNHLKKDHPLDNVNHNYYIEDAQAIIDKIERKGKKTIKKVENQLTMF